MATQSGMSPVLRTLVCSIPILALCTFHSHLNYAGLRNQQVTLKLMHRFVAATHNSPPSSAKALARQVFSVAYAPSATSATRSSHKLCCSCPRAILFKEYPPSRALATCLGNTLELPGLRGLSQLRAVNLKFFYAN